MAERAALVVGASRGLGLGLVREYLGRGWDAVGTVRGERTGLHALTDERLRIERLDIDDDAAIAGLRERLSGRTFDVLFVNAGVANQPGEPIEKVATMEFIRVMTTNALSPMRVIGALEDLVRSDGVVAAMSSGLGSVAANEDGGWEVYRASKAALNTLMRSYKARAATRRTYLVVAPGWVRTDMGGPNAPLDVETSVRGVVDLIEAEQGKPGVRFMSYQARTVPW